MPKNYENNRSGEDYFNGALEPVERARQLADKYPELGWMVSGDTHASPEKSVTAAGKTVGAALFPDADKPALTEFDRAYTGIAALDWVRSGDYESLTACQPEPVKLTRETFSWLQQHTADVLRDDEAADAMEAFVAINDLGKIGVFVDAVRQMPDAPDTVDHDVLMLHGLRKNPDLSPSFAKLSPKYQEAILGGMGTNFNLGQFMQAEGVAASLNGLKEVEPESREFYLLHTLYDLAGAAGQNVQNGSVILTEPTAQNYRDARDALDGLSEGKSVDQAYFEYLGKKAEQYEMPLETPKDVSVTRLATMMRVTSPEQAERVKGVYESLPKNTRAILDKELNMAGTDDGVASLIYYSPALLANLQKQAGDDPEQWEQNIASGMTTLARVYQQGRARKVISGHDNGGVQTILISELAAAAAENPNLLQTANFEFEGSGFDVTASMKQVEAINIDAFPQLGNLGNLRGKRVAVVGMGGGSDGIQAAILAELLADEDKTVPAVVSVRTSKPQSQGLDGTVPQKRSVQNHGGEVADGVFSITSGTTGSGRFLEHLPAGEVPMFLVEDNEHTPITAQLQALFEHVGGVDAVIGLDTGGDVLYGTGDGGLEAAMTTPDQDVRSLKAIKGLGQGIAKYCAVVAAGIDSPANAQEVLQGQDAAYFEPNPEQTGQILETYKRWHMDGSDDRYFGKTPLAWQKVLQSDQPDGVMEVNLPTSVVVDGKNPWVPYVMGQRAMRGMFFTELNEAE